MEVYKQRFLGWRRWYYEKQGRFNHRAPMWGHNIRFVNIRLLPTPFWESGSMKFNLHERKSTLFSVQFHEFCQVHSQVTTTTPRTLKSSITPPKSHRTLSQLLPEPQSLATTDTFSIPIALQHKCNQQHGDLWVWLLSLNVTHLRFSPVAARIRSSFLLVAK